MACQVELFTLLDPAQRTNVTFLGEVVLTKSKLPISKDVVAEIASVSVLLVFLCCNHFVFLELFPLLVHRLIYFFLLCADGRSAGVSQRAKHDRHCIC